MNGRSGRTLAATYGALVVTHLIAQLTGHDLLADITQWVAMPLLVITLLAFRPPTIPLVRLTLLALFFSWLGDLLPHFAGGQLSFVVLLGMFLVAQLVYISAFWPYSRESVLRTRWVVPYAVVVIAMLIVLVPHAGVLIPAVLIYALALGSMAVLATGVHPAAAIGAVLFLISDSLIALNVFVADGEIGGFWVMSTYLVAQGLLAYGVLRRAVAGDDKVTPRD